MIKLTLISTLFFFLNGIDTNPDYEKAMTGAIQELNSAGDAAGVNTAINTFERIAAKETQEWLPKYYMAYSYVHISHFIDDPAKKDESLDMAQKLLDETKALKPDMSEWHTLQGYIQMMKIAVNPTSRGQELSPACFQNLETAKSLNPENPRPYLLLGQMNLGTAMFFNQSIEQPCAQIQQALTKFETFKPTNHLAPNWGREIAAYSVDQCKSNQNKQ